MCIPKTEWSSPYTASVETQAQKSLILVLFGRIWGKIEILTLTRTYHFILIYTYLVFLALESWIKIEFEPFHVEDAPFEFGFESHWVELL